jgi:hypothetical protein
MATATRHERSTSLPFSSSFPGVNSFPKDRSQLIRVSLYRLVEVANNDTDLHRFREQRIAYLMRLSLAWKAWARRLGRSCHGDATKCKHHLEDDR